MDEPEPNAKNETSRKFVAETMAALKVTNARQLALALELTGVDDERKVRRWITGEAAPDFDGTMRLFLALSRKRPIPEMEFEPRDPIARLEAAVSASEALFRVHLERLEAGQKETVKGLRALAKEVRALTQRRDDGDPPAKQAQV